MPALFPPRLDYTDKDQASLHARIRNLLRSVFPNWTEESIANFGNMIVELVPDVGDMLAFYLDQWGRESRVATAVLRRSLLGIMRMIDFTPQAATAAVVTETFTLAEAAVAAVTLLRGQAVRTAEVIEPASYQLLADLVFEPGETSKDATVENTEFVAQQFLATGLPGQQFLLSGSPFLVGSLVFTAANGAYSVVDNFLNSSATDRHLVVNVDASGRATAVSGNGVNGEIPQGTVETEYKTGGGTVGNVEAGTLTVLDGGPFTDALGNPVVLSVTNAAAATPAVDAQTNLEIRLQGPRSLRVLTRSIAREDFEIIADTVPGVVRSLMLFKDQEPAVDENAGRLSIVPIGGGTASQLLLDTVRGRFVQVTGQPAPTHPRGNTLNLSVFTAAFKTVDVSATLFLRAGVTPATGKADVEGALERFFAVQTTAAQLLQDDPDLAASLNITAADGDSLVANPRIDFGFKLKDVDGNPSNELAYSDIFNVVRDVATIRKIGAAAGEFLLNGNRADVVLGTFLFPKLGTVTLTDGDTGLLL